MVKPGRRWKMLVLLLVPFSLSAAASAGPDAVKDAQALVDRIQEHTPYMEDYLHVFLGHLNCEYDFVSNDVLNNLADGPLKEMSAETATAIRRNPSPQLAEVSPEVLSYMADLAVLSAVEIYVEVLAEGIRPQYEDAQSCTSSRQANENRYLRLQRRRSQPKP